MNKVGYIRISENKIHANKIAVDIVGREIENTEVFSDFLKEKIGVSLKEISEYVGKIKNKRLDYFFQEENGTPFRISFFHISESDETIVVIYDNRQESISYEVKQNLMAMAVHDMKTPLSSIKETILLLSEEAIGQLNDMQRRCVAIADKEMARLQKILENLSRIGWFSGISFEENVEKVDVYGFVSEISMLLRDKSMKKKINVNINSVEDGHFFVYGNKKNILNLFFYLGDFGVEYAKGPSIDVEFLQDSGFFKYVVSFVSDNAPDEGIFNSMIGNFWENKETALIRKENICAFSLRLCSFWASTIGGKINYKNDSGNCVLSLLIPG